MTNFRGIVRIYRFRMEELEVCALVGWVTRSQVMIVRSHGHSSNLFRRPAAVISQLRSWKGTVNKIKSRYDRIRQDFPTDRRVYSRKPREQLVDDEAAIFFGMRPRATTHSRFITIFPGVLPNLFLRSSPLEG